jgi:predicted permease
MIGVLALGIAITTTIFTLVDELLLNPFPYRDANELVMVWEANPSLSGITAKRVPAALTNFEAWQQQNHSFQALEAYQQGVGFNLTGQKIPERLIAARATPGLFSMLATNPILGRTFLPGDNTPGAQPSVILSYTFWTRHFGETNPIAQKLLLDGVPYTIVGVLPREFHLPALFEGISEYKPDVWVPLTKVSAADDPQMAKWRRLRVCARLKPGVSIAQAEADMNAIAARRAQEDPELDRGYEVSIFPLQVENTDPELRDDLRVFFVAAILVLLLACISLAGLMLVRTASRSKNTAIMTALGAGRWALIAPVLSESFVIALLAGIIGLLLSYGGVHVIAVLKPSDIHAPERLAINSHAFIFTTCISVLTVMIFGLFPAWLGTHGNLNDALKSGPASGTSIHNRTTIRSVFVAVQIAVSVTLAIAAALLIRSFEQVLAIDPGFTAERVLTAHLALPLQRYKTAPERAEFCRKLREHLQAVPGIDSVALIDNMPLYAIRYTSFEIEGRPTPQRSAAPSADDAYVTPEFFHAMNIALRSGRLFTEQDAEINPANVVIINEALARQQWANQDPLGSHIRPLPITGPPGPWQTVVGVVGDFRQFNTETAARPELLWPAKAFAGMTVIIRTARLNPSELSSSLEKIVWSIDPDQPLSDVQTLEQMVADYNSQRKFNTLTLSACAALSVILMLLGIYGLISSFISAQIREIGIRLALGAQRTQVCASLMIPALLPVLIGIAVGLALSLAAKQLVAHVLFQVSPMDLPTYILIPVALIVILLLTSAGATIRAARLEPAQVLRQE